MTIKDILVLVILLSVLIGTVYNKNKLDIDWGDYVIGRGFNYWFLFCIKIVIVFGCVLYIIVNFNFDFLNYKLF
jgi:hypothetical protein